MIGQAVRVVREAMGIDGKDLAQTIGISGAYLSRIENNKRNPSPSILSRIDMVAADHGVASNLLGMSDVNDLTARNVHVFMSRDDVSILRKESARALIESIMSME